MLNEIYHHGILGMKWGVRRFQNEDGTLTPAGKERHGDVRKENKRVLRKKLAEGTPSKKAQEILSQWHNDLSLTEEQKEYDRVSKYVEKIRQEIEKTYGVSEPYIHFDADTEKWVRNTLDRYNKRSNELWEEKYADKYLSTVLNDLGYDDTIEGRKYLKRMGV